jgi:hypothetical protein
LRTARIIDGRNSDDGGAVSCCTCSIAMFTSGDTWAASSTRPMYRLAKSVPNGFGPVVCG